MSATTPRKQRAARRVVVAAGLAAADAIARAAGEEAYDPEDDFGGPDVDAEIEAELGPPPPAPPAPPLRQAAEEKSEPPAKLAELGEPPSDPAAAMKWLYTALVISAHHAMNDPDISHATRRRELRTIAAAASKLYPDSARFEISQLIKKDREEIDRRKRARAGAALERKASAPSIAKVIPIRGDGDQ